MQSISKFMWTRFERRWLKKVEKLEKVQGIRKLPKVPGAWIDWKLASWELADTRIGGPYWLVCYKNRLIMSPVYTQTAKYSALATLNPTIVHPCVTICFVSNLLPVSQTRCPTPFSPWNVSGNAIANFAATFAATGKDPNAAASVALSRCQPNSGDTRYAAPKQYKAPESTEPVMRWKGELK
jgi:hypothetical protein